MPENNAEIDFERVVRSILVDKPRIRLYEIMWDYSSAVKMVPENLNRMVKDLGKGKLGKKIKEAKKPKIGKKK